MRKLLGLELDPLAVPHELDGVAARLGDLDEGVGARVAPSRYEGGQMWVDNVLHWKGRYLPVEVELNANITPSLTVQLDQYLNVDAVDLTESTIIHGEEVLPHVLVIDTSQLYLYDGAIVRAVFALDQLHCIEDVFELRTLLRTLI